MMLDLIANFTWAPGFKGILVVAVAVVVLCGSAALILGTNSGARLGFLIAIAGLFGWFVIMGSIWSIYGIGPKGRAPTWNVVSTVSGSPAGSGLVEAQSLPLPSDVPDPGAERTRTADLVKAFPPTGKAPTLGDLITVDEPLRESINDQVAPWKLLETSNKYFGETSAVVAENLGPKGQALFDSAADYVVIDTYVTGGKTGRSTNSIIGRIKYKFTSALQLNSPSFYAAVQLQPVVAQETKPGEAPPLPVADKVAPVYTIVLERDRGQLRLPSISFTIFSGIVFGITCNMLHRRDKLAMAQRSAIVVAGAA